MLNSLLIGVDNNRGQLWRFFNGKIDDIRIYNGDLSEREINSLYKE